MVGMIYGNECLSAKWRGDVQYVIAEDEDTELISDGH